MDILTGYDFGNSQLAEYDMFYRGRSLVSISKIPYSEFVDISEVEDEVYDRIVNGELDISRDPVNLISGHIERSVKKQAKYIKEIAESPRGDYDDAFIDAIGDALFERNTVYVSYRGIESEVGPVEGRVRVDNYVETLTERGKILSRNEQYPVQGWYARNLLAPANGLLQTHTRLVYKQVWKIAVDEEQYTVIAYKGEDSDGVLIYNEWNTVGLFPLSIFTEDWTSLIGSR